MGQGPGSRSLKHLLSGSSQGVKKPSDSGVHHPTGMRPEKLEPSAEEEKKWNCFQSTLSVGASGWDPELAQLTLHTDNLIPPTSPNPSSKSHSPGLPSTFLLAPSSLFVAHFSPSTLYTVMVFRARSGSSSLLIPQSLLWPSHPLPWPWCWQPPNFPSPSKTSPLNPRLSDPLAISH